MTFEELREKYSKFVYEKYEINDEWDWLNITYFFNIEWLTTFTPSIKIEKKNIKNKEIDNDFMNYLVFHIGLVELISYWKCCCPENVEIKAWYINEDQIKWFKSQLYEMSKIPVSRFDVEAQQTWFGTDPTAQLREEIDFGRFVTRLRNTFIDMILKPIKIQVALAIPDIKNDKRILDSISMKFNSYNQFEEMMNIEIMSKRIEFIGSMKEGITETDDEGEEVPYFDSEFLMMKYLHMSQADLELNEKLKRKNRLKKGEGSEEEGDEEGGDEEETGGGDEGGSEGASSETESDEGVDSEMLGDVEPESTETTQA